MSARSPTHQTRSHRSGPVPPSLRSNLLVLAALLVLLGLSAGSAPEALCIIAMKPVTPKFALTPSTVK